MAKIDVAPLVGAWIEIDFSFCRYNREVVAPLVGAWIEIKSGRRWGVCHLSLPSWERGLKFCCRLLCECRTGVAPLVGAWIEIMKKAANSVEATGRSPRGSVD